MVIGLWTATAIASMSGLSDPIDGMVAGAFPGVQDCSMQIWVDEDMDPIGGEWVSWPADEEPPSRPDVAEGQFFGRRREPPETPWHDHEYRLTCRWTKAPLSIWLVLSEHDARMTADISGPAARRRAPWKARRVIVWRFWTLRRWTANFDAGGGWAGDRAHADGRPATFTGWDVDCWLPLARRKHVFTFSATGELVYDQLEDRFPAREED